MKEINDTITPEKVKHYLDLTSTARQKATAIHKPESEQGKMLSILLKMADDYASDAQYFFDIGDYIRAFGAINYAHAWIDAGIKLRLLDGHGDDHLFTLP